MSQRRRKHSPGAWIAGTPYRVTRFIGSGAMGAVYEVEHRDLQKAFVMKMLHEDLVGIDDSVRRIRRESQLLAKLEHVNIVKVTDAGFTASRVPYFVMERLQGETLASRMRRQEKWPVPDVVELSIGVLDGLLAAHSLGIVHRDVKPSNIFLAQGRGIKLLDFGIAKSVGADACATAKGITLGTPRYMSPEQAIGVEADCRSDLYALGVVMYELLAGVHPFAYALTPVEMMIAHAGWQSPPLLLHGDTYLGLPGIVERLLSKDPDARPQTAEAVREAILQLDHNKLLSVSPSNETELTCVIGARRPSRLSKYWVLVGVLLAAATVATTHITARAMNANSAELRDQRESRVQVTPTCATALSFAPAGTLVSPAPEPSDAPGVLTASPEKPQRTGVLAKPRAEAVRAQRIPGVSGLPSAVSSTWPGDLDDLTRR